jgi:hypothetical protein
MCIASLAVPRISDPATLEAIACREALALAADTLCPACVYCFRLSTSDQHNPRTKQIQPLLGHLRDFSSKAQFEKIKFAHKKRSSNTHAHNLARSYLSLSKGIAACGSLIPLILLLYRHD